MKWGSLVRISRMQIFDTSNNDFMGMLPLRLLENWKARQFENVDPLPYIYENPFAKIQTSHGYYFGYFEIYTYSMNLTNKGKNMFYEKVLELFIAIDFSSNKFVDDVPKSIENLKRVQLFNLSNNYLNGHIPPSLGNLIALEALDLSKNNLSGKIPQQIITFLRFFDISHNNLTEPIPQGKQFGTFENNSFEGNSGLCGRPLTKTCGNSNELTSQPSIFEESQNSGSPFEFGWKIVVIRYGFGFVVGVIIEPIVIAMKHVWLMKTFRIR
jgi:hypothetical protein